MSGVQPKQLWKAPPNGDLFLVLALYENDTVDVVPVMLEDDKIVLTGHHAIKRVSCTEMLNGWMPYAKTTNVLTWHERILADEN